MPGPITIRDSGFCEQDSDDVKLYVFDFDALNLAEGVELVDAGTLIVTPSTPVLTTSNHALMAGNRKVQVRLGTATTVGVRYRVAVRVTTDEVPAQIKEKWFTLRIKS